jgi:hypothetical protein
LRRSIVVDLLDGSGDPFRGGGWHEIEDCYCGVHRNARHVPAGVGGHHSSDGDRTVDPGYQYTSQYPGSGGALAITPISYDHLGLFGTGLDPNLGTPGYIGGMAATLVFTVDKSLGQYVDPSSGEPVQLSSRMVSATLTINGHSASLADSGWLISSRNSNFFVGLTTDQINEPCGACLQFESLTGFPFSISAPFSYTVSGSHPPPCNARFEPQDANRLGQIGSHIWSTI